MNGKRWNHEENEGHEESLNGEMKRGIQSFLAKGNWERRVAKEEEDGEGKCIEW